MAKKRPLTHEQTEQLLAIYRDLSRPEIAAVEEHLAHCRRCSAFAAGSREMDAILRRSGKQQPDPELAENFYKAIENDGRSLQSWFQSASRLGGQLAGLVVLLVIVFSTWLVIRSGPLEPPIEEPTLAAEPSATPIPVATLQPLYTLTQTVTLFAVSPESSYLATVDDKVITIWDTIGGKWLNTIYDQAASIEALAFTPNGANLLGRNTNGQFHRWLAYNGAYQRPFEGPTAAVGTPFALGNTALLIVNAENKLELWPLIGSRPNRTIPVTGQPIIAVAISAGGQSYGAVVEDGSVHIWNDKKEGMDELVGTSQAVKGLAFTRDGRNFATFNDHTIQIWQENALKLQLASGAPDLGTIESVQFISEDQYLLVNHSGGFLQSWNVNTGELVKTFEGQSAVKSAVALTRNSLLYLTLDSRNELTIWEKPEE